MKDKDENRYFHNSSFPLVQFLFTKDQQIAGIRPTEEANKKEFVFVRTPRLEELVDLYKFGDRSDPELLVPVHKYEQARRELLDVLNSDKF